MSTTYSTNWSGFSEVRDIEPFPTSPNALDQCGFRWTPAVDYHLDQSTIPLFENNPMEVEDFMPEFQIRVNHDLLESDSGRSPDDLELHLVVRDKSLNHFGRIDSRALKDVPEVFSIPESVLSQLCGARGLDFGIIVSPVHGIAPKPDLASSPGHVVAQKFFHLGIPSIPASGFPVDFELPEQFEQGVDKKAVWYIRWLGEEKLSDPAASAEDILRVVYNKNCSDKLYRIPNNDPAGKLFWAEIAVEIFLEIASVVLSVPDLESPPKGASGFYPTLFRTIEKITNRPIAETQAEFLNMNPSALSRLRASLHAFFNTANAIDRAKFGH